MHGLSEWNDWRSTEEQSNPRQLCRQKFDRIYRLCLIEDIGGSDDGNNRRLVSASRATIFQAAAISFKTIRSSSDLASLARRSHRTANSRYRTDVSMWGQRHKGTNKGRGPLRFIRPQHQTHQVVRWSDDLLRRH